MSEDNDNLTDLANRSRVESSRKTVAKFDAEFVQSAAQALYDDLDRHEVIAELAQHQMFEEEIVQLLGNHLIAFLKANWPKVQELGV